MIKILVTDGMDKGAVQTLKDLGNEVTEQFFPPQELKEQVKNFNVMVVRSATKVRKEIIDSALQSGNLKMIIRAGVGVDNIDVAYAESKGIKVRNTPKASSLAVAELALGHMFSLARFIGISNVTMREGKWNKKQYGGPCPPIGKHRYFFKLFAIDIILNFKTTPNRKDILKAIEGHITGKAELIGLYQKKQ